MPLNTASKTDTSGTSGTSGTATGLAINAAKVASSGVSAAVNAAKSTGTLPAAKTSRGWFRRSAVNAANPTGTDTTAAPKNSSNATSSGSTVPPETNASNGTGAKTEKTEKTEKRTRSWWKWGQTKPAVGKSDTSTNGSSSNTNAPQSANTGTGTGSNTNAGQDANADASTGSNTNAAQNANADASTGSNTNAAQNANADASTGSNTNAAQNANADASTSSNTNAGQKANADASTGSNTNAGQKANADASTGSNTNAGQNAKQDTGTGSNTNAGQNAKQDTGTRSNTNAGQNAKLDTGTGSNTNASQHAKLDTGTGSNTNAGLNANADAGQNRKPDTGTNSNPDTGSTSTGESHQNGSTDTGASSSANAGQDGDDDADQDGDDDADQDDDDDADQDGNADAAQDGNADAVKKSNTGNSKGEIKSKKLVRKTNAPEQGMNNEEDDDQGTERTNWIVDRKKVSRDSNTKHVAGNPLNVEAGIVNPENRGKFGYQLSPHRYTRVQYNDSQKMESPCPVVSRCKLESFIIFDEFLGKMMDGTLPPGIREVYKRVIDEQYLAPGKERFLLRRLDGTPDLHLSRSVRAMADDISLICWRQPQPGHAVSAWRSPKTGHVYFCNSGDECTRQGVPKKEEQPEGSFFSMCNGIVQFAGVSKETWTTFKTLAESESVISAKMMYATVISLLAYDLRDGISCEELLYLVRPTESLIGTFTSPHTGKTVRTRGFPYPAQVIGNCAFRATLLGLMAAYVDAVDPDLAHVPLVSFYVTEHVYCIFLDHAVRYLQSGIQAGDINQGHLFEADELELITQCIINQRQHFNAVRAAAKGHSTRKVVASSREGILDEDSPELQVAEVQFWDTVAKTREYLGTRFASGPAPGNVLSKPGPLECFSDAGVVRQSADFVLSKQFAILQDAYALKDLQDYLDWFMDPSRSDLQKGARKIASVKFTHMVYRWYHTTQPSLHVDKAPEIRWLFRSWAKFVRLPYPHLHNDHYLEQGLSRNSRDGLIAAVFIYAAFERVTLEIVSVHKGESIKHIDWSLGDIYEYHSSYYNRMMDCRTDCWSGDLTIVKDAMDVMDKCVFGTQPGALIDLLGTISMWWEQEFPDTKSYNKLENEVSTLIGSNPAYGAKGEKANSTI